MDRVYSLLGHSETDKILSSSVDKSCYLLIDLKQSLWLVFVSSVYAIPKIILKKFNNFVTAYYLNGTEPNY